MSIGIASRVLRIFLALAGAFTLLSPHLAAAQDDDEDQPLPPPSPAEIAKIEARSLALLRCITPQPLPINLLRVLKPRSLSPNYNPRPLTILETAAGTIRWGTLFSPGEIVALVSLAPAQPSDNCAYPPQYLCYFAWQKGRWVYRQFLGNAYTILLRYRTDSPSAFVLARYQYGRYQGDFVSWAYDSKSRLLDKTNFEDWGPFYLAGNYLVGLRGFERRAHDDTHWIHSYANGKKGPLLAVIHDNDSGYFDITIRNPKSGSLENWHFRPDQDDPNHVRVTIRETSEGDVIPFGISGPPAINDEDRPARTGELTVNPLQPYTGLSDNLLDSTICLRLLTGIDFSQLDDATEDAAPDAQPFWPRKLPPPFPTNDTRIYMPIHATGAPEIVERFQWPRTGSPHLVDTLFDPLHGLPNEFRCDSTDQLGKSPKSGPESLAALKARALRAVADIDPSRLHPGTLANIETQGHRGICGSIFGDDQLGALVAVRSNSRDSKVELCLLLWQNGWKFRQDVGQVPAESTSYSSPCWTIKMSPSPRRCYVVGTPDYYPSHEYVSWLCDPRTHHLEPTGWPMDAVPSISGDTITFTFRGSRGVLDIRSFRDGRVRERIATVTQPMPGPPSPGGPVVTVWNHGKPVTWQIWNKSQYSYQGDLFALSRTPSDQPAAHPREDILVKFDWEGVEGYSADLYLLSRITGLGVDALRGIWDTAPAPEPEPDEIPINEDLVQGGPTQGEENKIVPPRSATVTGPPDAVSLLQWPQSKTDSH